MRRFVAILCLLTLAVTLCACVNMQAEVAALPSADVAAATLSVRYIAHRGLTYATDAQGNRVVYGENTAESFANAAATATDWGIETDVWQTADGALVCMHDKDAVEGVPDVHAATLAEVLGHPLRRAAGYYAPTFDTYLQICHSGNKTAVVEIKDADMSEACLDDVLRAIAAAEVPAVIISFHLDKLLYVRRCDLDIPCMLLFHSKWQRYYKQSMGGSISRDQLLQLTLQHDIGLSVEHGYLYDNKEALVDWVTRYHQAGLAVGVWTVDDVYDAVYHATAMGVDYVTTNVDMGKLVAETIR